MSNSKYIFLEMYEDLFEEIRFLCNSRVRLKILKTLYNCPKTMKEINDSLLLSYSSISTNLIKLENEGFLIKNNRLYYLNNIGVLNFLLCLDFNNSIKVSNNFVDFLKTHDVSPLCEDSLRDISSLDGANLIESVSVDIYKPHNEFKNYVDSANILKVIFPYLHPDYPEMIKNLLYKGVPVDVLVNMDVLPIFINQLGKKFVKDKINEGILSIKYVDEDIKLALAVSDNFISISLFKSDGSFDQNRLIISKEPAAIKWGNSLFNQYNKKAFSNRVNRML